MHRGKYFHKISRHLPSPRLGSPTGLAQLIFPRRKQSDPTSTDSIPLHKKEKKRLHPFSPSECGQKWETPFRTIRLHEPSETANVLFPFFSGLAFPEVPAIFQTHHMLVSRFPSSFCLDGRRRRQYGRLIETQRKQIVGKRAVQNVTTTHDVPRHRGSDWLLPLVLEPCSNPGKQKHSAPP